jgi:hypothetical protein
MKSRSGPRWGLWLGWLSGQAISFVRPIPLYTEHCTLREEKRAIQDNGRSCRSLQRLGGRVGDTDLSLVS